MDLLYTNNEMFSVRSVLLLGFVFLSLTAVCAANSPCSGKKGGVSHCQGAIFICNDGSVSASKRNCSAVIGGSQSQSLIDKNELSNGEQSSSTLCLCRGGRFCTGPRGGIFCYTDNGRKSYIPKK